MGWDLPRILLTLHRLRVATALPQHRSTHLRPRIPAAMYSLRSKRKLMVAQAADPPAGEQQGGDKGGEPDTVAVEPAAAPPATPAAPARKRRAPAKKTPKPPQDIGIASLVLGAPVLASAAAAGAAAAAGEAAGAGTSAAAERVAASAVPAAVLAAAGRQAGLTREGLQEACSHLAKADPKLVPYIEEHGPPERLLAKQSHCFATLAKSIMFQQLATNAAAAIYGRVLGVCGCEQLLSPQAILAASEEGLRGAGLSARKVSYLQDLASLWQREGLSDQAVAAMEDEALRHKLLGVRGIGEWSVDMFRLFHLGHPDILPVGDLAVRRGMAHLYNLKGLPSAQEMEEISEAWRPYRSVGSYYMWRVEVPRTKKFK